jgi:Fic family protein
MEQKDNVFDEQHKNEDSINKVVSLERQYSTIVNWWKSQQKNSKEQWNDILRVFEVEFTANSLNLDGLSITPQNVVNIFTNGKLIDWCGEVTSIFAAKNHQQAFKYMIEALIHSERLSQDVIQYIHYNLMRGLYSEELKAAYEHPNRYRKSNFLKGSNQMQSNYYDIYDDVQGTLDMIACVENMELSLAPLLLLRLNQIQPFADGNGRTARMVMNYYLMLNNHPPIVIYVSERQEYEAAVQEFDKTGSYVQFKELLLEETVRTWKHRITESQN